MRYPIPPEGLRLTTPDPAVTVRVDADGVAVIVTHTHYPYNDAESFASIDGQPAPWLFNSKPEAWAVDVLGGGRFIFTTDPDGTP